MTDKESYSKGETSIPLLKETIGQNLKKTALNFPDKPALVSIFQKYRSSYSQFWEQTTHVAKNLLSIGVKKGDRVGLWAPNCYEWVLVQYATARIGTIMVSLNTAYRSEELQYALNQSGCSYLFSAKEDKYTSYTEIINGIKDNCPALEYVAYFEDDFNKLLHPNSSVSDQMLSRIESEVHPDDPVNIQYTSGTTGNPKGVTLSHTNILNNGFFIGERLRYSEDDSVCIPVPLFHCFGMVIGNLACTTHGATIVLPHTSFDPEKTLRAVEDEKCTSLYGVPTMFASELNVPEFEKYDLSSLRTGVMAGSVCPREIMSKVKSLMHMEELSICYGMTETSPVSIQSHIGIDFEKQINTVGMVMDHLEIKMIDPDTGEIVDRGIPGEICTRGYSVMLKYWNDPVQTDLVIDDEKWMHSGDLGIMDEEGYVQITGRIKDLIIRAGENISPKYVEDFLHTLPDVTMVQVVGVPSEKYGEEVMAWIQLSSNSRVTRQEIHDLCMSGLPHFMQPKYIHFTDSFPTTASGKVRKDLLRIQSVELLKSGKIS